MREYPQHAPDLALVACEIDLMSGALEKNLRRLLTSR